MSEPLNKYTRVIKGVEIDFYDIARAYQWDPALEHAMKKGFRLTGTRETARVIKDVDEMIWSLNRYKDYLNTQQPTP